MPATVRVTLVDGSRLVVWHASMERDSLIARRRFAAHQSQVQRMEGRGPDFLANRGRHGAGYDRLALRDPLHDRSGDIAAPA